MFRPLSTSNTGVLADYEPPTARARTFVPRDVAKEMVRRLMAERLSQSLIRMFPVDSAFPGLKPLLLRSDHRRALLQPMPPREVPNCKFVQPASAQWRVPYWDWAEPGAEPSY